MDHLSKEFIVKICPAYGYNVNASKTHLMVKESHLSEAQSVFENTCINITSIWKPHLDTPLKVRNLQNPFVRNLNSGMI